mgnify:CR=1 FL=1
MGVMGIRPRDERSDVDLRSLRRRHADLMAQTAHLDKEPDARERINAANLTALDREIRTARAASQGQGWIAVNVMKALSAYEAYVRQALQSGANALVVGAGLPLDLPELAREHPDVALIPILSDARGVQLLVRKWERKQRLPDAIVIEHPRLAGGHLGAARIADLGDPRFDFERCIPESLAFLRSAGLEQVALPQALSMVPPADAGDLLRPLAEQVAAVERRAMQAALAHTGGNRAAAARLLGMSRASFYGKLHAIDEVSKHQTSV